jgi:hypothetical protein
MRSSTAVTSSSPPTAEGTEDDRRHVHVRLSDSRASILDLVTEYLQAAGKAPDWYWRIAGRLEEENSDEVEDLISSAFEAGAFVAHEHPEDVRFDWVSEEECERERKAEERGQQKEERGKDRSTMSHYA